MVLKTGSVNQINHYPVDSIVFIVEPKTDLLACVPRIPAKRAFPHSDHVSIGERALKTSTKQHPCFVEFLLSFQFTKTTMLYFTLDTVFKNTENTKTTITRVPLPSTCENKTKGMKEITK